LRGVSRLTAANRERESLALSQSLAEDCEARARALEVVQIDERSKRLLVVSMECELVKARLRVRIGENLQTLVADCRPDWKRVVQAARPAR
jgi:hypothetical protein